MSAANPTTRRAHAILRSLLDGVPCPDALAVGDLGVWQEPVLVSLLATGDGDGVRTTWTVAELYAADFPPPRFVVPDLLPAGLTILAGRPKLGKSWLALQVAAAAMGASGHVLDQRAAAGSVLYLALEDTPGRLKDRALKQGYTTAVKQCPNRRKICAII